MSNNTETQLRLISLELSRLTLLVTKGFETMSAELDTLTQEVAEQRTATTSLITLVTGLATQIREHVDDRAKLLQLASDLDAQQAEIAAAVTANTPSA